MIFKDTFFLSPRVTQCTSTRASLLIGIAAFIQVCGSAQPFRDDRYSGPELVAPPPNPCLGIGEPAPRPGYRFLGALDGGTSFRLLSKKVSSEGEPWTLIQECACRYIPTGDYRICGDIPVSLTREAQTCWSVSKAISRESAVTLILEGLAEAELTAGEEITNTTQQCVKTTGTVTVPVQRTQCFAKKVRFVHDWVTVVVVANTHCKTFVWENLTTGLPSKTYSPQVTHQATATVKGVTQVRFQEAPFNCPLYPPRDLDSFNGMMSEPCCDRIIGCQVWFTLQPCCGLYSPQ